MIFLVHPTRLPLPDGQEVPALRLEFTRTHYQHFWAMIKLLRSLSPERHKQISDEFKQLTGVC